MQFEIEEVNDIQRRLKFSVPEPDVRTELNEAYRTYRQRARVKGFRPGKVPRAVIKRRFGSQIIGEVTNRFLQKAFEDQVEGMDYFGQPQVESADLIEGRDFTFTFLIEVEPSLSLSAYTGLEVTYPAIEIADDRIDAEVSRRLESRASLAEVTDPRPVRGGDAVMCELKVLDDEGEVIDQAPGTMIRIGEETWYKGLDARLIGVEPDVQFEITADFAEDAGNAAIAGKSARVEGRILSIQELRPPALSDELAEELGYEGGAGGMRAAIQATLQGNADEGARNQARANLLQVLVGANEFAVPGAMTDQFLQALMQEMQLQQWQQGRDVRQDRFSDAEMTDLRNRARFAAKASLILKKVAELETITVEDAELDGKIQEIADARGQRVEAIKGYLQKEEAFGMLRDRVLEEKTLDWLLEQSELVTPAPAEEAPAPAAEEPAAEEPAAAEE